MALRQSLYELAMEHTASVAAVVYLLYLAVGWLFQETLGGLYFEVGATAAGAGVLMLMLGELFVRVGGDPA